MIDRNALEALVMEAEKVVPVVAPQRFVIPSMDRVDPQHLLDPRGVLDEMRAACSQAASQSSGTATSCLRSRARSRSSRRQDSAAARYSSRSPALFFFDSAVAARSRLFLDSSSSPTRECSRLRSAIGMRVTLFGRWGRHAGQAGFLEPALQRGRATRQCHAI